MVFNDQLIKELGEQIVTPFNPDNVSAASIDLTLGDTIVIENGTKLSIKEDFGGMYVVEPGEFLLMTTAEIVHIPNDALAIVKGKSSRAREGLAIEFANLIDPGFFGPITLEVKNMNQERSIILEPGMKIAQMYFMRLTAPAEHPYSADHHHYQGQEPATDSWQRGKYTAIEEWKPIRKYKGFYEVSNLGRVRSLPRDTKFGQRQKLVKGQILKPIENNGYLYACLCKHNKSTRYAIHRLVADAFIPNYDNLPQVNHIDENKHNNRVDNLEWCTALYNNKHSNIYEKSALATRIPVVQYTKDGRKIAEYPSMLAASKATGVSVAGISACVKNRRCKDSKGVYYTTKTAGGFVWQKGATKAWNDNELEKESNNE